MEWRLEGAPDAGSVVVEDDVLNALLDALRPTGVPIDPYRDAVLGSSALARGRDALAEMRRARREAALERVRATTGARVLPAWAEPLLARELAADPCIATLDALVALCDTALERDLRLELLGR